MRPKAYEAGACSPIVVESHRSTRIAVTVSPEEKEIIESAADSMGLPTAVYVRMLTLQASSDRLPHKGGQGDE
jgi:hypothetical protein